MMYKDRKYTPVAESTRDFVIQQVERMIVGSVLVVSGVVFSSFFLFFFWEELPCDYRISTTFGSTELACLLENEFWLCLTHSSLSCHKLQPNVKSNHQSQSLWSVMTFPHTGNPQEFSIGSTDIRYTIAQLLGIDESVNDRGIGLESQDHAIHTTCMLNV
jgi:hypothetical protein